MIDAWTHAFWRLDLLGQPVLLPPLQEAPIGHCLGDGLPVVPFGDLGPGGRQDIMMPASGGAVLVGPFDVVLAVADPIMYGLGVFGIVVVGDPDPLEPRVRVLLDECDDLPDTRIDVVVADRAAPLQPCLKTCDRCGCGLARCPPRNPEAGGHFSGQGDDGEAT